MARKHIAHLFELGGYVARIALTCVRDDAEVRALHLGPGLLLRMAGSKGKNKKEPSENPGIVRSMRDSGVNDRSAVNRPRYNGCVM